MYCVSRINKYLCNEEECAQCTRDRLNYHFMRRLYAAAIIATTLLAYSCQKEFNADNGGGQQSGAAIPADFDWRLTRDVSVSAAMPTVEGAAPDYAVIRVYSSPVLADGNLVAMGVVKPAHPTFDTAITISRRNRRPGKTCSTKPGSPESGRAADIPQPVFYAP